MLNSNYGHILHRFLKYLISKNTATLKFGSKVNQGDRNGAIW